MLTFISVQEVFSDSFIFNFHNIWISHSNLYFLFCCRISFSFMYFNFFFFFTFYFRRFICLFLNVDKISILLLRCFRCNSIVEMISVCSWHCDVIKKYFHFITQCLDIIIIHIMSIETMYLNWNFFFFS